MSQSAAPRYSSEWLASLPSWKRQKAIECLPPEDIDFLSYDWHFWRREKQTPPPGDWTYWLIKAGRGYGKTRIGAEWVRESVREFPLVNLAGATADDARDIMIEGESGILAVCPKDERPIYRKSERQLHWPNGAKSLIFTADEPERFRGKQHMKFWCLAAGTMVLMADGSEKPIETVRSGDLVQTLGGPQSVIDTMSRLSDLCTVQFENGTRLVGSGDHPIATDDGWIQLRNLPIGAIVYLWADDGERTPPDTSTATKAAGNCTDTVSFGRRLTAPFRRAATSIISTARRAMTGWRTFGCCRLPTTWDSIRLPFGHSSAFAAETALSAEIELERRATAEVVAMLPARACARRQRAFVGTAEPPLRADVATTVVSGVSTSGLVGRVYNLTVDGPHHFFANRILTHNCDEIASWRYPEAFIQMKLGLRLGAKPQAVITTTPRPTALIKELLADPACVVTEGTTYENRPNLSPTFYSTVIKQYEGTRLGRQELLAHLLDDNPNAIFKRDWIERNRVVIHPDLGRVVVAIDPAASNEEGSAETGIVVAGMSGDDFYILDDRSLHASPEGWARAAIVAYHLHACDRAIGEANNGGDMIEALLRNVDPNVSYNKVTATRGKVIRAEPISALYEQGRVHHVGTFPALEDQCCEWEPGMPSPDRMDALVWSLTELSAGPVISLPFAEAGEAREALI